MFVQAVSSVRSLASKTVGHQQTSLASLLLSKLDLLLSFSKVKSFLLCVSGCAVSIVATAATATFAEERLFIV